MPNDTPVSLSSDELAVISLGPRFIPVARDSLRASEWSEAIALFEHRIAVHLMFDGVPFPERRVDTTLVTMQYQRSTSGLFELEKGPLKDRVLDLSRKVLRACNEQAGTRTSARTNLSPGQLHALHTLKSRRDIVCRPCDKGLGPCVMTREWYNTAARALLSDRKSYEVLPASTTIADLVCKVYCEFDALLERFDFSAGRRASAWPLHRAGTKWVVCMPVPQLELGQWRRLLGCRLLVPLHQSLARGASAQGLGRRRVTCQMRAQ
jgi:hypothetical protein